MVCENTTTGSNKAANAITDPAVTASPPMPNIRPNLADLKVESIWAATVAAEVMQVTPAGRDNDDVVLSKCDPVGSGCGSDEDWDRLL